MEWDNKFDHFKIQISSQEKTKVLQLRKGQQLPLWKFTASIITKQQLKLQQ